MILDLQSVYWLPNHVYRHQTLVISKHQRSGEICYYNAAMGGFFHTLKTELVHLNKFSTRQEAKRGIFEYIEAFYNRKRIHSTLGYVSPEAFEERYYEGKLKMCS